MDMKKNKTTVVDSFGTSELMGMMDEIRKELDETPVVEFKLYRVVRITFDPTTGREKISRIVRPNTFDNQKDYVNQTGSKTLYITEMDGKTVVYPWR